MLKEHKIQKEYFTCTAMSNYFGLTYKQGITLCKKYNIPYSTNFSGHIRFTRKQAKHACAIFQLYKIFRNTFIDSLKLNLHLLKTSQAMEYLDPDIADILKGNMDLDLLG